MQFDVMTGASPWAETADRARSVEREEYSGILYTETTQTPWMMIAVAASAAPTLTITTGIAVAFQAP